MENTPSLYSQISGKNQVFETIRKKETKEEVIIDIIEYEDPNELGEEMYPLWIAKQKAQEIYNNLLPYCSQGFLDQLTFDDLFHFLYPEVAHYEEF
jgi:hypothetical protein